MLNQAIADGQSDYQVAKAFGLKRGAILRHRRSSHPGVPGQVVADEAEAFKPAEGETAREKLLALIAYLEGLATDGSMRTDLARELRMAYTDLGKLPGGAPPAELSFRDVDGLEQFLADVLVALEPHLEARLALLEVVRRHDLG